MNTDAHASKGGTREEFLTARQLAAFLQVSESTVRRLARAGRIPSVRLTPRLIRFNLKAVCRALDGDARPRHPRQTGEPAADDAQLTFAELLGK
ncbi:MAG TPA: helix-turn-helix domain-containing protein [Pyrinomonadaceae bacterium]|nr:helix-turn-helix domain-containing protein [Pyrinomonadaceae bacterium]